VVYSLTVEEPEELEPVERWTLPGSVTGYTPPLPSCFERGRDYAWTLRAHREEGPGDWAEPRLFAIAAAPSAEDVAAAIEVLELLGARSRSGAGMEREPMRTLHASLPADARGGVPVRSASAAIDAGVAEAHLKVAGEVRTIDPDDPGGRPRIWGRGRVEQVFGQNLFPFGEVACQHPDSGVRYGLSVIDVDWGSAADACPAGTWVCRRDELAACDTVRDDDSSDYFACDGSSVNRNDDSHLGWLADDDVVGLGRGGTFSEDGSINTVPLNCSSLPVWCCWQ
jgi:hypothetical protein